MTREMKATIILCGPSLDPEDPTNLLTFRAELEVEDEGEELTIEVLDLSLEYHEGARDRYPAEIFGDHIPDTVLQTIGPAIWEYVRQQLGYSPATTVH